MNLERKYVSGAQKRRKAAEKREKNEKLLEEVPKLTNFFQFSF